MKKLGKTIFEVVAGLVLWALLFIGIFVIALFSPSLAHFLWFGLAALLSWVAYWGVKRSIQKPKQLICPNGCNVTQTGSKFCGQCGAKLIWR
jgi:uncharacterized membrane protein